jgi:hypothetical protein
MTAVSQSQRVYPSVFGGVGTVRIERMLDLFQKSFSWSDLVGFERSGIAVRDICSIVLVESLLQHAQNVLLLEEKTRL